MAKVRVEFVYTLMLLYNEARDDTKTPTNSTAGGDVAPCVDEIGNPGIFAPGRCETRKNVSASVVFYANLCAVLSTIYLYVL